MSLLHMLWQPNFALPWDNTNVALTLNDSSFLLVQCMGLKMGEPFGVVARFAVVDDVLSEKIF